MKAVILHQELVCTELPTAMCHGSTLLPLGDRVLAAWFGGSREGEADTAIYLAVREAGGWGAPRIMTDTPGPHWNPVLTDLGDGSIALYCKVGGEIARWRTMVRFSRDGGSTWTPAEELVPGDRGGRGPVRCKVIRLADGALLAPASTEQGLWEAFADRSEDNGRSWRKSTPVRLEGISAEAGERTAAASDIAVSEQSFHGRGVIQPTLWESRPGEVHMLLRSTQGRIFRSDSTDGGRSWGPACPTQLPNNNSGIDVAGDGSLLLLAWNPVGENWGPRTPMRLSASTDNGVSWETLLDMDSGEGEFSYPAVVRQGEVFHIAYTWKRKNIACWQITTKATGAQRS